MKLVLAVLAATFALSLQGCGSQSCIILANGGRKLCGDDAKAWCDSTDGIRSAAGDLDPGNSGVDDSQNACDTIRSK